MSKPVNKHKKAKRTLYAAIATGAGIFYLSLHLGKCWNGNAESIDDVMLHALIKPFDIFPINTQVAGTGLLVALITMLLIYQYFLNHRNLRPDEESGSAKWNEDLNKYYKKYADVVKKPKLTINENTGGDKTWTSEIDEHGNQVFKHTGTKNMILSQEVVLSMNTRKTRLNNNVLVIGGSGTGKSRFVMKPNILQANSSFVITDPSGELLESMGSFLRAKGYEIKVFNLVQMDHSNCYNPFTYIRNEEGVLTMINALIKNTTPKGSTPSDPFWEKAETALLQAICFYLIAECSPEEQNFNSVMKLLRCAEANENSNKKSVLDVLMDKLRQKNPEHIALQSYAVFKSAGGGKTAQSILISCQTRLQVFNLSVIKQLTNTDDIDLKSIGDRPTALFCITPVVDTTFNFLVALMYTQLFDTLYYHAETECNDIYHQGLRLPVHVRFLLDEFANIGNIPEFSQKLATMRKYEISCTIVIQALSQLKAMYKDDWEVLIGNCDTHLFLGGSDATTLDYISKKLGKETIRAKNTSRNFGRSGGSSTSFNQTGRELMQPDEIARMDNQNCLVFIRGILPFFATKYDYPKHPNYKMTGDADSKLSFDIKRTINTAKNTAKPSVAEVEMRTKSYNKNVKQNINLKKNNTKHEVFNITEKDAEMAVSERYNLDSVSSEFETDDDMSSVLDASDE